MKSKFSTGASILLALALVIFGVVYGSVSGYADERAQVNALLVGDNGITTVLGYRASDGLNLCVVAERHIAGDESLTALREAAMALRTDVQDAAKLKQLDATLQNAYGAVAAKLRDSVSFAASERDQKYLDMLTADFNEYGQNAIYGAYNKAVAAFDQKLQTPVLGDIARFFGIKGCALYQ